MPHPTRTSPTDVATAVSRLRAAFTEGRTKPVAWRRAQLRALRDVLTAHETELQDALKADLGKGPAEAFVTGIGFTVNEIDHTLSRLTAWLRPRRVRVPLTLLPARARIVREPLGTVLIISPWNRSIPAGLRLLTRSHTGLTDCADSPGP